MAEVYDYVFTLCICIYVYIIMYLHTYSRTYINLLFKYYEGLFIVTCHKSMQAPYKTLSYLYFIA